LIKYGVLAYPWKNLAPGSLVVDVGGGVGSVTLVLAKAFPELKFVVQDTPQTIKDGHVVRLLYGQCMLST
jgi:hypothetical protein